MSEKNIVSQAFRDKLTGDYHSVGSTYVSDDPKRINELEKLGYLNDGKVSDPKEDVWPKWISGRNFELSNGEKVTGKDEAIEAQKALDQANSTE